LSSSVKFDFPLDEVLIRQTTTMPNGIPFSQMTTEHTRRLFEFVDSSEEEELARRQFVASSEEEEELRREKFEEELEDTLASLNFFQEQCSELKNERKELKHKMEELKGDSEKLDDALIRAAVATKTYDDFVGDLKVIDEENKELKEKLDGVKDILQTETLASGIQNRFYEILNDEEDDESDDEE